MTGRTIAAILAVESIVIGGLLLMVADQIAHTHVERLGGVNIWGYRGPVLHQKQPNEVRVAVVGGDLAFGWGVAASETLAPSVRDAVSHAMTASPWHDWTVKAVPLGALGLAPADYASWIDHYAALAPDVVCLVLDPSRHALARSPFVPARRSAAFTRFGYSPILPLVLEEKGAMRRSAPRRLAGRSLTLVDRWFRARESADAWTIDSRTYLDDVAASVRAGLRAAAHGVVVVIAPDVPAGSLDRQGVKEMVALRFGHQPVRVVDLGDDPAMHSAALRLDGFNFSTAGHAVAARDIAPAVVDLMHLNEPAK